MEFKALINSSQYFWYSPVPNLDQEDRELKTRKEELKGSIITKDLPRITIDNGLTKTD